MNVYKSFGKGAPDGPAVTAPGATLGQMDFAFIDMGQGDCTIISAPDNSVYIVDCGSKGHKPEESFEEARDLVRAWAGETEVDVILTHPDEDHYNQLLQLLLTDNKPDVQVSNIFFSCSRADDAPLRNYKVNALGANILLMGTPWLLEVTLNAGRHQVKRWTNDNFYKSVVAIDDIPVTGFVIASGKRPGGMAWSMSIIAGNVTTEATNDNNNCASLVTLAQLGNDKLLLTGDATSDTLAYLLANQKPRIQNTTLFQIPHHGSGSSMPTDAFKRAVNPQGLLVSVGGQNYSYNLPRWKVLEAWWTCPRVNAMKYVVDYWKTAEEADFMTNPDLDYLNEVVSNWTAAGYEVIANSSHSAFWLFDPAKAQGPSGTGFYGFVNTGFFLYRETKLGKDLYLTGIMGSAINGNFY